MSCAGCGFRYCNKACQLADWRAEHKRSCLRLPAGLWRVRFRFPEGDLSTAPFVSPPRATPLTSNDQLGAEVERVFCHAAVRKASDLVPYLGKAFDHEVAVDCCLAAQIILAAAGKMEAAGVFGLGAGMSWTVMAKAARLANLGTDHSLYPGYLCPKDEAMVAAVQGAGGSAQGQWLLGPDKYGLWLGHAFDMGLQRKSLEWWHAQLLAGLRCEIAKHAPFHPNPHLLMLRAALAQIRTGGPLALDAYVVHRHP